MDESGGSKNRCVLAKWRGVRETWEMPSVLGDGWENAEGMGRRETQLQPKVLSHCIEWLDGAKGEEQRCVKLLKGVSVKGLKSV